MQRRDLSTFGVLLLLLALVAGFGWLTRHPDTPLLARAEGWPGIGRLAVSFRRAYLPPPAPAPASPASSASSAEGEDRVLVLPAPPEGRGQTAPPLASAGGPPEPPEPPGPPGPRRRPRPPPRRRTYGSPPAIGFHPPDVLSPVVVEADAFTRVLQLQSAGDWHRVSLEGQQGWLLRTPAPPGAPPLPATVVTPRPLPGRPPDPERLAAVEKLLGVSAPTGSLGPYPLYSDDADSELIWFLDRVAAGVEPAFRKRYGCPPLGAAAEAVVLFG